jgi:Fic family protein
MVSIITKKIKGNEYLYLVHSIRNKDKIIKKNIKYIGKKRPIQKEEFDCMVYSYNNEDWVLNNFQNYLSYQGHNKMKKASDSYKIFFNSLDKVSKEKEREKFLSIFISNSNSIEGSTMTVKDTFNYLFKEVIPEKINKKEIYMADNLFKAWLYVESNYKRLPTKKDLFKLHALVNKNIEEEFTLGKYKIVQNYIGDTITTSHLFVDEKMNKLFDWIKKAYKEVDDFEIAFQSHAQFEIIHPFIDGNGRIGRLLINWLLMYKKLSPLAILENERNAYINSLENSRKGKVEAIVKFCFKTYINQYQFV